MSYRCNSCGKLHAERPTCFISEWPTVVQHLSDIELARRTERSSDQCILDGKHFFILANLDVPIAGTTESLRWTVWSTLSEANFDRASDLWTTPGRESEPPYFGWLSNQIPGYVNTVNIRVRVHTQAVGIRPQLEVIEDAHPLVVDQAQGVTLVRADDLIHSALGGAVGGFD